MNTRTKVAVSMLASAALGAMASAAHAIMDEVELFGKWCDAKGSSTSITFSREYVSGGQKVICYKKKHFDWERGEYDSIDVTVIDGGNNVSGKPHRYTINVKSVGKGTITTHVKGTLLATDPVWVRCQ